MKTIEELEREEAALWQKLKDTENSIAPLRNQWCETMQQLQKAKLRAEILAEQPKPE